LVFVIAGVFLSYPVLFAFDRGNNVLIAVGFVLCGLQLYMEGKSNAAAVFLAAAAAMKIYPVFFFLLFVSRRDWRALRISVVAAAGFTIVPLFFYSGGFFSNLTALYRNTANFRDGGEQVALNHSLYGWALTLRDSDWLLFSPVAEYVVNHYTVVCILMASLLILPMLLKSSALRIEHAIICATLNCLFIPITYGYAHVFFLSAVLLVTFDDAHRRHRNFVIGGLGLLLASKGIPVGPPGARLLNYMNAPVIVLLAISAVISLGSSRLHPSGQPSRILKSDKGT
jgi:hypothetical protein